MQIATESTSSTATRESPVLRGVMPARTTLHTSEPRDAYTPYTLLAKCVYCTKPIVVAGLCYSCATGRPRTLRRREEHQAAAELVAAA